MIEGHPFVRLRRIRAGAGIPTVCTPPLHLPGGAVSPTETAAGPPRRHDDCPRPDPDATPEDSGQDYRQSYRSRQVGVSTAHPPCISLLVRSARRRLRPGRKECSWYRHRFLARRPGWCRGHLPLATLPLNDAANCPAHAKGHCGRQSSGQQHSQAAPGDIAARARRHRRTDNRQRQRAEHGAQPEHQRA